MTHRNATSLLVSAHCNQNIYKKLQCIHSRFLHSFHICMHAAEGNSYKGVMWLYRVTTTPQDRPKQQASTVVLAEIQNIIGTVMGPTVGPTGHKLLCEPAWRNFNIPWWSLIAQGQMQTWVVLAKIVVQLRTEGDILQGDRRLPFASLCSTCQLALLTCSCFSGANICWNLQEQLLDSHCCVTRSSRLPACIYGN